MSNYQILLIDTDQLTEDQWQKVSLHALTFQMLDPELPSTVETLVPFMLSVIQREEVLKQELRDDDARAEAMSDLEQDQGASFEPVERDETQEEVM